MNVSADTRSAKSELVDFLYAAAVASLAYAVFSHFGHFSSEQSILLSLPGMYVCYYIKETQREEGFHPFQVTIQPHWQNIFRDFRILDQEQMEVLWKQIDRQENTSRYNILRDDVTFTVLRPDLIYSNDYCSFHSDVEFAREIKEITGKVSGAVITEYCARFRVKTGDKGYELGMKTAASFEQAAESEEERGFIKIATIPYHNFLLYFGTKRTEKWERTRDKLLKEHGWTLEDKGDITWWPEELHHKYFTVFHKSI